jgi:hypothetical protein
MQALEFLFHTYPFVAFVFAILFVLVVLLVAWAVVFEGRELTAWGVSLGGRRNPHHSQSGPCDFTIDKAAYYRTYYGMIKGAQVGVKTIGDGFSCHDNDNIADAISWIEATRMAINNGAVVKRFQFDETLSVRWMDMLIALQIEAGDKFQLYMNSKISSSGLPYVICIIDEDIPDKAAVNIMFTRRSDTALKHRRAGPSLMVRDRDAATSMSAVVAEHFRDENHLTLAQIKAIRSKMHADLEARTDIYLSHHSTIDIDDQTSLIRAANEIKTLDVAMLRDLILSRRTAAMYFAYGSNMALDRLKARCPSARKVSIGRLDNHAIAFNLLGTKGEGKGGGIANVVPSITKKVFGVLYSINSDELKRLNQLEASMRYSVEKREIDAASMGVAEAIVYVANGGDAPIRPTDEYRKFIMIGASENQLPAEYVKELEQAMTAISPVAN